MSYQIWLAVENKFSFSFNIFSSKLLKRFFYVLHTGRCKYFLSFLLWKESNAVGHARQNINFLSGLRSLALWGQSLLFVWEGKLYNEKKRIFFNLIQVKGNFIHCSKKKSLKFKNNDNSYLIWNRYPRK